MIPIRPSIIISTYDDITNPYYGGGGAVAVHEVAKRLHKKYNVTVISSNYPGSKDKQVIDGVMYHRIGFTPDFFPQLGQLIFLLSLPWQVLRNEFDIWLESFTPPYSTAFLPLFTRKPVIGVVHYLAGKEMFKTYKIPFHWIEAIGLRLYKKLIVPSTHLQQELKNLKAEISIIPNGITLPNKTKTTPKKQILFLGRISVQQKGLDLLLKAFSTIAKNSSWNLVIAGNGLSTQEKTLQALLAKSPIKQKISWIGKVDAQQKHKLLRESAVMVVPSREETFSMSALEAAAYGLPVVSFSIPGLSWLSNDGSLKATNFSARSLAFKLKEIISSKTKRFKMSLANRQLAKAYSWETVSRRYQESIENLL